MMIGCRVKPVARQIVTREIMAGKSGMDFSPQMVALAAVFIEV